MIPYETIEGAGLAISVTIIVGFVTKRISPSLLNMIFALLAFGVFLWVDVIKLNKPIDPTYTFLPIIIVSPLLVNMGEWIVVRRSKKVRQLFELEARCAFIGRRKFGT